MGTTRKLSKKEQILVDKAERQESPFIAKGASKPGELDQFYTVTPIKEWGDMKKYNNFIIQGEVYKNNHFVYVRGQDTPKGAVERDKDFWVARILQVRAANPQHVYALVAWMYWPEELPPPRTKASDTVNSHSGQRKYHGSHELIASNYMEVLDVLSFAGKADVFQWDEEDDNLQHKLYWRQTFCRETQELSAIREHCICGGHFNPEIAMEICDNPSCKVWLHEDCLIDDILTKTYQRLVKSGSEAEAGTNGTSKINGKKGKGRIWKGSFQAKLNADDGHTTVSITDLRENHVEPRTWTERVSCLKCGAELD